MHLRNRNDFDQWVVVYTEALSMDEAFDNMEPFNTTHRCKMGRAEGEWIFPDAQEQLCEVLNGGLPI